MQGKFTHSSQGHSASYFNTYVALGDAVAGIAQ